MREHKYILDEENNVVPVSDVFEWAAWVEKNHQRKIVKRDTVAGYLISTVFLFVDYNFSPEGEPIVFETMVFKKNDDYLIKRYSTWAEALEGHEETVKCWRSPKCRKLQIELSK